MNELLEDLISGLNPLRDFDEVRFYNHWDKESISEIWYTQRKNLAFFLTLPKPLIRGCVVGGTVGTIVGLITGNSPDEGASIGIAIGGIVDFKQYAYWGLYHYFKAQKMI